MATGRLKIYRLTATILAVGYVLISSGCMTTHIGNKIDKDKLSQITKGVTTRAQVEQLFGEPDSVGMASNGDRMMMYTASEGHADQGHTLLQAVPVIGLVVPEHTSTRFRMQMLRVMLRSDDIVNDFAFTDDTKQTDTDTSFIGGGVEQHTKTVPNADAK